MSKGARVSFSRDPSFKRFGTQKRLLAFAGTIAGIG
jgi:hypothetical protein